MAGSHQSKNLCLQEEHNELMSLRIKYKLESETLEPGHLNKNGPRINY